MKRSHTRRAIIIFRLIYPKIISTKLDDFCLKLTSNSHHVLH